MTRFRANQQDAGLAPMPGNPVMRIYKGDLIALDHKGARTAMVVRQLWQSICLLAAHNETGNLQARHDKNSTRFAG